MEGPRTKRTASPFLAFLSKRPVRIRAQMPTQKSCILHLREDRFIGILRATRSPVEIGKKCRVVFSVVWDDFSGGQTAGRPAAGLRPTSIRLPSDFCPTSVRLPSDFRPTSIRLPRARARAQYGSSTEVVRE